MFAGIRPLVQRKGARHGNTAALSRGHTIRVEKSGMITGERREVDDLSETWAQGLCRSRGHAGVFAGAGLRGRKRFAIRDTHGAFLGNQPETLEAEVAWAVRETMARTVEDVLARRMRTLFLNAEEAVGLGPPGRCVDGA